MIRSFITVTAVLVALTAPAAAKTNDQAMERKVLTDFGKCVVEIDPLSAKNAVLSDLDSTEIYRERKKLLDSRCLPSTVGRGLRLQMDDSSFKAALAQALIFRDLQNNRYESFAQIIPLFHRQPYPLKTLNEKTGQPLSEKAIKSQKDAIARKELGYIISRMGECVVRTDPAGARTVVFTPISSPEEMAAVKAMGSALSGCIAKGERVAFNRLTLRNTMAINYYRLANATPGGTQ